MNLIYDDISTTSGYSDSQLDNNQGNEYQNSIPVGPEIDQPKPDNATPAFPDEMPVREGK